MPQDLVPDPRSKFAATLADSGLPLLARAVAAGAIGGPGVRAVLDRLASPATDGYDDAALAEAEEFLTSIAAATDPAHVARELRVHCDEVLRPHLDLDADDELDDEAWLDDLEPAVAGTEVAANVEAESDETPRCEIAIDATATDPSPAIRSAVEVPTPDDGRNGEVGAAPSPVGGPTLIETARVVPRPPSRGRSEDAAPSVASRVGSRTPAGRGRPVPAGRRVSAGRAQVARAGSRHPARRARAGDPPPVRRDLRRHRLGTHTAADRPRRGTTPGHAAAGRTDRHGRTGRAPPAVPIPA